MQEDNCIIGQNKSSLNGTVEEHHKTDTYGEDKNILSKHFLQEI